MYLTEANARSKGANTSDPQVDLLTQMILLIGNATLDLRERYDIFLSHSIRDAGLVLGVKRILEEAGKTVYVDWVEDPNLDRGKVSAQTAEKIRQRMRKSDACFYLYSRHSRSSKWMPWELGFFDGMNGNVAVLPLLPPSGELDFSGQEYLELYPKVDVINLAEKPILYVNKAVRTETASVFKSYDLWRTDVDKLRPHA